MEIPDSIKKTESNQHVTKPMIKKSNYILISFLILSYAFNAGCDKKPGFKQAIDFSAEWKYVTTANDSFTTNLLRKKFKVELQQDQLCLLEFKTEKVNEVWLNNMPVAGFYLGDKYMYDITDNLKKANSILVRFNDGQPVTKNLEVELHLIHKLFIVDSKIEWHPNEKTNYLVLSAKLKNTFITEKQARLRFELYSINEKPIAEKETLLFIDPKAETTYRQKIPIDLNKFDVNNLTFSCKLLSSNRVIDVISDKKVN